MRVYLLIFLLVVAPASRKKTGKEADVFAQLYPLQGSWIMKTKKGVIGEKWKKLTDDFLQSTGYLTRGADTIITESVALRNTSAGIFYTSTVADQNNRQPVAFRLSSSSNNTFVFTNPEHDFPKRITYRFVHKDSLEAWIDDGKTIPEKKQVFRYARQL